MRKSSLTTASLVVKRLSMRLNAPVSLPFRKDAEVSNILPAAGRCATSQKMQRFFEEYKCSAFLREYMLAEGMAAGAILVPRMKQYEHVQKHRDGCKICDWTYSQLDFFENRCPQSEAISGVRCEVCSLDLVHQPNRSHLLLVHLVVHLLSFCVFVLLDRASQSLRA